MAKIIELNYCYECPRFGTNKDVEPACKQLDIEHLGRKVPPDQTIPSWCPLLDKVQIPSHSIIKRRLT